MLDLLSTYRPSVLEELVISTYQNLGVDHPDDIDPDKIAHELGVTLIRSETCSMSGQYHNKPIIVVDTRVSEAEQREDFFHELTHVLRHSGNQLALPDHMREVQERDARTMPYFWLVPTFLLMRTWMPPEIGQASRMLAQEFGVTVPFAKRRLEMLVQRFHSLRAEQEMATAIESMPKLGRDYDEITVVGRTELYYKHGALIARRTRADI